jgi:hypothetical protein
MSRVRNVVFASGEDRSDLINELADARDIPAELLVAQAIAESGLNESAERWAYQRDDGNYVNLTSQAQAAIAAEDWDALQHILDVINSYGSKDISFGPGQQTVAFASVGDQSQSLDNVLAVRDQFLTDPAFALQTMADQLAVYWHDYGDGSEAMGRYNWPARGLSGNPNAAHIRDSWQRAQAYIDTSDVAYNPDVPTELQRLAWTCSIRSTAWLLHSIGDGIAAEDLQDLMVPGLVDSNDGLHDGSGTALAAFIGERTGLPTQSGIVDWAFLQTYAGVYPIIMGSGSLYHWVGVRKVNPDGAIALANPAPNWKGVGQELTYGEYVQYALWYGVWIPMDQGVPSEEGEPLSDAERAELDRLKTVVSSYENDTFTPLAETMDSILAGGLKKDEIVSKVGEMRESIRTNVGV